MNKINFSTDQYNTDKLKMGSSYPDAYSFHFLPLKNDIKILLEIGVGMGSYNGGSLEMWADLFPDALIIGIDWKTDYKPTRKNIVVEIGDATDENFLLSLVSKYGRPDVVLDDGGHMASQMKRTFDILYPHTNILYAIEDLQTQYSYFANGSYLDGESMMSILHKMIDENNYTENKLSFSQICFNKYQCFIYKNNEAVI